ncbi:MAG: serine/threonine protein kinase [Gemmataceae bacterium]|nr:serine/threonine protein kinase [Gemmataceae bacterium]
MTISTTANLVDLLRQARLLDPPQMDEVTRDLQVRLPQPRPLAQELMKRGWVTPYQINQLFMGKANELALGPYIILERLGEGGVGYVFKARHQHMGRFVAVKVIRKDLVTDTEVVGRFYREIHAVSQLIHPNIVVAYDAGPVGQTHFFAMEYVEGIDFVRLVKKEGPLDVERACDYIRQAALGLQHIHERGLVHRDIKPSNLLVAPNVATDNVEEDVTITPHTQGSKWGLVKILDLGLARLGDPVSTDADTGSPLTVAGGALRGTADYLSPEQAVDFHRADIRCDIYSLGCTFYFLLTGQAPFEGGTLAQKLMKHQTAEPTAVEKVRAGLPKHVPLILRKMMAKKPDQRYQKPAQIATALGPPQQKRSWLPWRS